MKLWWNLFMKLTQQMILNEHYKRVWYHLFRKQNKRNYRDEEVHLRPKFFYQLESISKHQDLLIPGISIRSWWRVLQTIAFAMETNIMRLDAHLPDIAKFASGSHFETINLITIQKVYYKLEISLSLFIVLDVNQDMKPKFLYHMQLIADEVTTSLLLI